MTSKTIRTLLVLALLAFSQLCFTLQPPSPPSQATAPAASLALGGRTIFTFRSTLSGYPPQERADAAERRLERALAQNGPQRPSIRSISEGTQVLLDGSLLFLIAPGDVNSLAGDTTELLAQESAAQLEKALPAPKPVRRQMRPCSAPS